ncbi:MAG: PilZ domain-containing protein [Nitrospirales bacterium]
MIRSQLLGLGPDHSLLCALPQEPIAANLTPGTFCKGRSLLDGETYQFETTIQEVLTSSQSLRLNPPDEIRREAARVYPRLPVDLSGTVRPMSDYSKVLAVLPVTISNLCPTGCQLTAPSEAWPTITTMQVILTCQLPEFSHNSKFHGKIEWIDPSSELYLGIQFRFQSEEDAARQDLLRWFTSQQARLINTSA